MTQPDDAGAPGERMSAAHGEPEPRVPKRVSGRRRLILVLAVVLGVVLTAGGVAAFAVSRASEPATPSELVDAYLDALRDGDTDRAVAYWNDHGAFEEGQPPTRDRVRAYLESRREDYERGLAGKSWTLRESPAVGTGIRVDVTIGAATEAYVVVRSESDDERFLIFAGPEDALGMSKPEGNALLVGT